VVFTFVVVLCGMVLGALIGISASRGGLAPPM